MVTVRVRNASGDSATIIVEGTTTVREAMEQSGLGFGAGTMALNSVPVDDLDRKINSYGSFEEAWLVLNSNKNNA